MSADQPNPSQDERLTRLAQRRGTASKATSPASNDAMQPWAAPVGPALAFDAPTRQAPVTPYVAPRRRHAAAASRIFVGGLAGTTFFGSISAFALADNAKEKEQQAAAAAAAAAAAQAAATTAPAVIETVHQTVWVDENGNPLDTTTIAPLDPAAATEAVPTTVTTTSPDPALAPVTSLPPSGTPAVAVPAPAPAPAPAAAPPNTSKAAPAPVVTQPAPVATQPSPVVTQPAPVVTQPAPVVTEPAPVVTQPAPVVTQPPPVVTEPPPPPPTTPAPPVCQGTQC